MTHKKCSPGLIRICLLCAVARTLTAPASAEWKEKVLYSFQGGTNDGAGPVGGVVFDKQGNLYGVLQIYGPGSCAPIGNECGAVFQLAPPMKQGDPWSETLIYKFGGKESNDGESPNGGLIIDGQGNLYGVTAYGGTGDCILLGVKAGCGTVYEISPPKQRGKCGRRQFCTASQRRSKDMYRMGTWYLTASAICTEQRCTAGRRARPAMAITAANAGRCSR